MQISAPLSARVQLPLDSFQNDVPLVAVERGSFVGSLHRGTAAIAEPDGHLVLSLGSAEQPVFLRSAAKPFQVMPALLTGAVDRFEVSDRELAVLCASHSAQERHTETILQVLERAGLGEDALRCGIHPPLHEPTARERLRMGLQPTAVCNNCSGAHTGMLIACLAAGWPIETYGNPDHPLQVQTRRVLASFSNMSADEVAFGIDNCAVPTFRVPVGGAATAFARLATGEGVSSELRHCATRVVHAMTTYPEMVAGDDRFDTDLMAAAEGAVVAKGGAEGFQGIGVPSKSCGIAIKITDGNARAIPPVAMRLLNTVHALPDSAEDALGRYIEPELNNHQSERVGRLVALFETGPDA
jgi:L-asparaginase II